jgi:dienelactone hydrolase
MKNTIRKIFISTGILIALCIAVILFQNTFDMTVTSVQIPTSKGNLQGSLVLPKAPEGKVGLVIFIHGDGPADASYNGQYEPLWEELAKHGYASLSWSKPEIGGSSGNWLEQTMEDRALEANEVIDWAKTLPEIDTDRIGLWGASQAGWVIPKIVQKNPTIAFQILVAPAINWIDQGLYHTLSQIKKDGKSLKEQIKAQEKYEWSVSMLEKNANYQEYHNSDNADKDLSEDRWNFILKNYQSDSTEDIQHFYSPVKLFLGGRDIHVDSNNTKEVYEKMVPGELLNVTLIPTTDHYMLKAPLVDSKSLTVLTALFAPRQLADKTYHEEIIQFLHSIDASHKANSVKKAFP